MLFCWSIFKFSGVSLLHVFLNLKIKATLMLYSVKSWELLGYGSVIYNSLSKTKPRTKSSRGAEALRLETERCWGEGSWADRARIQRRVLRRGWEEHGGRIFKQQRPNFQEDSSEEHLSARNLLDSTHWLEFQGWTRTSKGVIEEKNKPQSWRSWGLRHAAVTFQTQGTIQGCNYQVQYIERMLGLIKKKRLLVY